MMTMRLLCAMLALGAGAPAAWAQEEGSGDLSALSIEELAQIPVQSASKGEEPLSAAPTSLYVITNEDIVRSGATRLPEVLRLAPNLQIQRTNSREYAITARGFNGIEQSNKILLLIDGRSAYSTLHSGIFWELRSPLIEDIAQIEVVSGPGGTLYGPNAVNGVISVISRDARDTIGVLARGTVGGNARTAALRYGFALGDQGAARVYANYFDREGFPAGAGPDLPDGIRGWQAGFRADLGADASRLTLTGETFDNETFLVPGDGDRGHNLLARWRGQVADTLSVQVQGYYDYFERRQLLASDSLETFDAEGQINWTAGSHQLVAGIGVRTTRDDFVNNLNMFRLTPDRQRLWIFNGFVQNRMTVAPGLAVIAGVKLERSSFSGLELLPSLRVAWNPDARTLIWASVSRAVRTPSRIDRQLNAPGFLDVAPGFVSEKLVAFEAGYRGQFSAANTLSVSLFLNRYDDIRSLTWTNGALPVRLANDVRGTSYGIEAWGTQQLARWWRLSAGLMLLGKEFDVRPGAVDLTALTSLGDDPGHQAQLRSQMDLPGGVTVDVGVRWVGALDRSGTPAYAQADARIGWMVSDHVELFAAGRDLLDETHLESGDVQRGQRVERSVVAGARLRF